MPYIIENKNSGFILGVYQGETEEEALENMYKDAGYDGIKGAEKEGFSPSDLILTYCHPVTYKDLEEKVKYEDAHEEGEKEKLLNNCKSEKEKRECLITLFEDDELFFFDEEDNPYHLEL